MGSEPRGGTRVRDRIAGRLRRLGRATARLERLQGRLEAEMDEVRQSYERNIQRARRRVERLRAGLEDFCRQRRDEVLPDGRKSLATPFGRIGFRSRRPKVDLSPEADSDRVCRHLQDRGLGDVVTVKRRLNRTALRRALRDGRIDREQLAELGVELRERPESFRCRLNTEVLSTAGGEA
ncbi:MAG: host-nuclease inhibitor Gam family protein [Planctomycetota bacterium]